MAMFTSQTEDKLLGGTPDYVLDAIDDIDTKVLLASPFVWSQFLNLQQHAL